jgi:hypothetical protein
VRGRKGGASWEKRFVWRGGGGGAGRDEQISASVISVRHRRTAYIYIYIYTHRGVSRRLLYIRLGKQQAIYF